MSFRDTALTTEAAWVGVWVRSRSHPTPKSWSGTVAVSPWHRISAAVLDDHGRIATVCRRLRYGLTWPGGLGALEIARPNYDGSPSNLPGNVCRRCADFSTFDAREVEIQVPDLDALADRVAQRLIDRQDEAKAAP